ncbi:MAG: NADH-quinone oxidoreductase subunit K [Anaerolineae bacterium]
MTLATIALVGVLGLLMIALYGLLILRNLLKIVVALQLLGKAAALALVMAGSISGQLSLGQSLAVTVIVVDTMTAVIALALAVKVRQRCGVLDVRALSTLRG